MKTILIPTVSTFALLLALNASVTASYSDDEDSSKDRYSVGKEEAWDRQSVTSRAFSDRRDPAALKKPSKEELSYGPEDEWEVGSQYTSRSEGRSKDSQRLADIKELRRYMNKGNLEITPSTHEALRKYSEFYETAFRAFDKGVVIKEWKTSLGFGPLLEILQSFSNLKAFKLGLEWDKDNDITELLTRTLQFYEYLTDLDISGCRLNDKGMMEVMEAIQNPSILKSLNVTNNALSINSIQELKAHFTNLASLRNDISVGNDSNVDKLPLSSLAISSQKDKQSKEKAKKELEERTRREAEEERKRQKKVQEEEIKRIAEEHIRKKEEERLKKEAEKKAKKELEERVKRETEEERKRQKKAQQEEKKRIAEEHIRKKEEERLKKEAEKKAKKELEERVKRETEEKTRKESEERTKREAEEKARKEFEEHTRREAEQRAKQELEEHARREVEEKARKEFEERTRREAEERARKEYEERMKREVEERARREAADKLKQETEEKTRKEAEGKLKRETGEKAKTPTYNQPTRKLKQGDINEALNKVAAKTLSWSDFAAFISSDPTLTTLNLHYNKIGDAGARALAPFLKDMTALTTLYLSNTQIGNAGAAALAPSLKGMMALTTLYLSWNQIGDKGVTALASSLKEMTALTTLNLSYNQIGDAGKKALEDLKRSRPSLDLKY